MEKRLHRWLRESGALLILLAVVAIVFYICTFKIIDSDFWWHVKSGEIMWKTGSLIHTEPYSYVLAGQPYTSSHEWLAQIIFYLVYSAGGPTAAILLRGALIAAGALFLLSIDRRSVYATAPLVVIVLYVYRASFMVRPQLFSIMLLCATFFLLYRYLQRFAAGMIEKRQRRFLFLSIFVTQLLWVNLHGGVAIYGVICIGAFFLQSWFDWYAATGDDRPASQKELRFRAVLLGAAILLLLASPNVFKTFLDLYEHRFDRTIPLVREWMPMSVPEYLAQVVPFALIGLAALCVRRRAWLFCSVMMLITGMLSLQAYRHCVVFVLVCTGVALFQFADYTPWITLRNRLLRHPLFVSGASLLLLGALWISLWHHDGNIVFRNNGSGFGVDMPTRGAMDFVEEAGITGTLFNTYNQGGYLLYRCNGRCQVFADGRNIQYGYPFLQKLMDASTNAVRWKELDDQYGFTLAVIEYKATPEYGDLLPYINHMQKDPTWALVYVDDDAAVYVRVMAQYSQIISQFGYKILTPHALEFSDVLEKIPEEKWPAAEAELLRSVSSNPESIKARLQLGNRYLLTNRLAEAKKIATDAMQAQPYLPEIYELLGRISVETQDWSEAGAFLEKALELTHGVGPGINYDYLAMVFSRAGQNDKADMYHRKAVRAGQASPVQQDL